MRTHARKGERGAQKKQDHVPFRADFLRDPSDLLRELSEFVDLPGGEGSGISMRHRTRWAKERIDAPSR